MVGIRPIKGINSQLRSNSGSFRKYPEPKTIGIEQGAGNLPRKPGTKNCLPENIIKSDSLY
jgi:hypothetical protein